MRNKIHPKIRVDYIAISITFLILLLLSILISSTVISSQDEELIVYVTDLNEMPITQLYEEENFLVSVYVLNESETPDFLTEVTIKFNNNIYLITGEEITDKQIIAPPVDSDTDFIINATKEGYVSNETILTVLDVDDTTDQLLIEIEPEVVDANKKFTVTVYIIDKDSGEEILISGVSVGIENDKSKTVKTNEEGVAVLSAPDNKDSINILASKIGYTSAKKTIWVNIEEPWWNFIYSSYFPIFIAIICLIFAVIFVNIRSKKSIFKRAKEISNEKMKQRYELESEDITKSKEKQEDINLQNFSGKPIRSQAKDDPKVEEIRISRPQKDKEIVKVETDEDKADKIVSEKRIKKKDYDWFEGKDDMRYEIDKLTGEVDEEGLDKWFEGIGDLREKIDEKVKKKDKKNKNNEDK